MSDSASVVATQTDALTQEAGREMLGDGQFTGLNIDAAIDLFEKGGPIVAVLALISIVGLAVALLKFAQFTLAGVGSGKGLDKGLANWQSGEESEAIAQLSRLRSPSAKVLCHAMNAIAHAMPERLVREDAERVALEQLAQLRSHLRILESTAQLAPLLGLFGTVIGMMQTFQALQQVGAASDPAALAGGIWVALITTAVGLAVAIPASFFLYWFEGRIEREKTLMETTLTALLTGRLDQRFLGPSMRYEAGMRVEPANAAE